MFCTTAQRAQNAGTNGSKPAGANTAAVPANTGRKLAANFTKRKQLFT